MTQSDYIPAGRTSRVVKGSVEYQIQTEYACRPSPRLTTSLFSKGEIIRKIEQELPGEVTSFEDKIKVEDQLRKQHLEILKIISDRPASPLLMRTPDKASEKKESIRTIIEKIAAIPGVEKIFHLDKEGNFTPQELSDEFYSRFSAVSKNLPEILNIFGLLPGGRRETGVCEIEPERLYFASAGDGFYFILVKPNMGQAQYETEIKTALSD